MQMCRRREVKSASVRSASIKLVNLRFAWRRSARDLQGEVSGRLEREDLTEVAMARATGMAA
jgi:hypothetical protein